MIQEKIKYMLKIANEKWNNINSLTKTILLILSILMGILLPKVLLFLLVLVVGWQRILYKIDYFTEVFLNDSIEKNQTHKKDFQNENLKDQE